MYLKHFALTHFPFDHTLAAPSLFAANAQAEAEIRLKHLLELRGIGLLTGEPGSGKTTLCRRLTDALHPGLYRAVYVPLTTGSGSRVTLPPPRPLRTVQATFAAHGSSLEKAP